MKNEDRIAILRARMYARKYRERALTEHGQVERRVTEDLYAVAAMRRYSRTM